MRHPRPPIPRRGARLVPMARDGQLAAFWRKLVNDCSIRIAPSCTTCAVPARSGARGTASLTRAEGIASAKLRFRPIFFAVPP